MLSLIGDFMIAVGMGCYAYLTVKSGSSKEISKPDEPMSDELELVIELLQSPEGWKRSRFSTHVEAIVHDTDVFIKKGSGTIILAIGELVIPLKEHERSKLHAEFEAFKTREKNSKREEVRQAFAKRVLEWDKVRPVLGERKLSSTSDSDSMGRLNSLPADSFTTQFVRESIESTSKVYESRVSESLISKVVNDYY